LGTGTFTIASPNSNTDRTLNLPDSGGTFLMEGASQSPTFGTVTATTTNTTSLAVNGNNISAVNSLGFRNRIINGDMRIDQRNNGASVTVPAGGSAYVMDRWNIVRFNDTTGTFTCARSTTVPTGFVNSALITVTAAQASVPSNAVYRFAQSIEGFNVADLGWGTVNAQSVTISFWARSSVTGTYGGRLRNSANNRSYVFQYTVNSANTFEFKTITIPGDTSGTWLTDNGIGITIEYSLGDGSNFQGTASAWQAGEFTFASGNVRLINTNGATFFLTGVQLEAGSVATPFERRDYGRELMMCMRYFYNPAFIRGGNFMYLGSGMARSSTKTDLQFKTAVSMRATPTATLIGPAVAVYGGASSTAITAAATATPQSSTEFAIVTIDHAAVITAGQFVFAEASTSAVANIVFSSEL
jgi:hypothetical protein